VNSIWRTRCALLAAMLLAASATHADQNAMTPPRLSADQIKRYFNSYPAAHNMAQKYWGKRKYTPPHKMLRDEGSFERAVSEMRWAGVLPDFDSLLQSYGFENRTSWLNLSNRVSHAYVILRLRQHNPDRAKMWQQARTTRMAQLEEERQKAQSLPAGDRKRMLNTLRHMENELEKERLGEIDASSLQPFSSYFKVMDRYLIPNKPW